MPACLQMVTLMKTQPSGKQAIIRSGWLNRLRKQWDLQLFVLPALIVVCVFMIAPLWGLQIAFRDYTFRDGILGSAWAGLKHFEALVRDPRIGDVIYNTVMISILKLLVTFPLPIIFALMLNEVRIRSFKRVVQTISYFPYFIAWVIVAYMATVWLAPTGGFVNGFFVWAGILDEPYHFLGRPEAFWGVSIALEVWKNLGYSSIIYLAALTAVDNEVIEASVMDGTTRLQRIWYIMLPAIRPVIMILFIINVGFLFAGGLTASNFQLSYTLGNALNRPRSDILDTYVLRMGLNMGRFSYAAAVSLLSSLVAAVLLFSANLFSKKTTGEGFF